MPVYRAAWLAGQTIMPCPDPSQEELGGYPGHWSFITWLWWYRGVQADGALASGLATDGERSRTIEEVIWGGRVCP